MQRKWIQNIFEHIIRTNLKSKFTYISSAKIRNFANWQDWEIHTTALRLEQ